MFYLIKSACLPDLKCPYCGTLYSIEWTTEYGDPIAGSHTAECEECELKFGFSVSTQYQAYAVEN